MALWQVSEVSSEDNDLFRLGRGQWFAPGECESDVRLGGALAFGKTMADRAEGGFSVRREAKHYHIIARDGIIRSLEMMTCPVLRGRWKVNCCAR